MSQNQQNVTQIPSRGIDPAVVEAAIQRGRVERSQAFHALLRALLPRFSSPAAEVEPHRGAKAVAC